MTNRLPSTKRARIVRVPTPEQDRRVRLIFEVWAQTFSMTRCHEAVPEWSRAYVRYVLTGQNLAWVAPEIERVRSIRAAVVTCSRCRMWVQGRPGDVITDGRSAHCSIGIPESTERGWARLCPTYAPE